MNNDSKSNKNTCMFVNLAEKLSIQNQIVIRTMDEIIERATLNAEQVSEKYQREVQKTLEAAILADLSLSPTQNDDVPKPKSLMRRNSNVSASDMI